MKKNKYVQEAAVIWKAKPILHLKNDSEIYFDKISQFKQIYAS